MGWGPARGESTKVERGNPEVKSEGWGDQAVRGHPKERGTHRRVPVHAGARAGDARWDPGQRGTHPRFSIHAGARARDTHRRVPMRTGRRTGDSPEGSGLSGIHGAHGLGAPRGSGAVPKRRSVPRGPGMDASCGAKGPASRSGFTSMTSSGVSMSSWSGSGSTRRGT